MCGVASKRRKKINIFSQSDSVCAEASTFSGAREARSRSLLTPNPLTHETTHANRFNDRMKQCTLHNEYQHSEETKKKKNRSSLMHSSTSLNFKLRSISCFNKNSPNKMLVQESTGVCKCRSPNIGMHLCSDLNLCAGSTGRVAKHNKTFNCVTSNK